MTTALSEDALAYLDQLARLTTDLPAAARDDLLAGIEEHMRESAARGELSESLVRLGPPEAVAASARDGDAAPSAAAASDAPRPARWMLWLGAAVIAATIGGFLALGALTAFTAHFDEDADWNVHPALVLFAALAGLMAGLFGSVLVIASRAWTVRERLVLIGAWIAAVVLAVVAEELTAAGPLGTGFVSAPLALLVGALGVVGVLRIAFSADSRLRGGGSTR